MSDPVELWLTRLQASVIYAELDEIREAVAGHVILLPVRLAAAERRWRTMHALGHMTLHCGNQRWMLRNGLELIVARHERQADEWAAERLIPEAALQRALEQGMEGDQLLEHFGVPVEGIAVALGLLWAKPRYEQNRDADELPDGWHFEPIHWPRCAFCEEYAEDVYRTRAQGIEMLAGWAMRTPLCGKHEQVMYEAGDRGRVFAGDGVRYWLIGR